MIRTLAARHVRPRAGKIPVDDAGRSGPGARLLARCVAALAVATLVACGQVDADAEAQPPATLESTPDAEIKRIVLTQRAVERLGIELAQVSTIDGRPAAPESALIYDASGAEWVYVSPAPLVFMRASIQVERFEGGSIILSRGPAAGTRVVTVGSAELLGTEAGL